MKKAMLSITGIQCLPGEPEDGVELVTEGEYAYGEEEIVFSYMESELTGLAGTKTTFFIRPHEVILSREGAVCSRMTFEEGRKHTFVYQTEFGALSMGMNTKSITSSLAENGGRLEIRYRIEVENAVLSYNAFKIEVKEV